MTTSVAEVADGCQVVPSQDSVDRVTMSVSGGAKEKEGVEGSIGRLVLDEKSSDDFIGAAEVEHGHPCEVDQGDEGRPSGPRQAPLDGVANRTARRTCDEVGPQGREGISQEPAHVDPDGLGPRGVHPILSGRMMLI
ncbi:MAG: hypothetical protein F4Y07_17190 [Gemmatimonadetes bacterium]|nr:hypothetical protein [Gemmatimonadota bacterium]